MSSVDRKISLLIEDDRDGYRVCVNGAPTLVEQLAMVEFAEMLIKYQFSKQLRHLEESAESEAAPPVEPESSEASS